MPEFNLQMAVVFYRKWNFEEALIIKLCDGLRKLAQTSPTSQRPL